MKITLAIGAFIAAATLVACGDSEEKKAADYCTLVVQTATAQQGLVALLNSGDIPAPDDVKSQLTAFRGLLSQMACARCAPTAIRTPHWSASLPQLTPWFVARPAHWQPGLATRFRCWCWTGCSAAT